MTQLDSSIAWLADAPLFIDTNAVDRFYDAVVKPETQEGEVTLEITQELATQLEAKLGLEAGVTPSGVLSFVTGIFPSIKIKAEGGLQHKDTDKTATKIQLKPIHTPQRQLVQLALHYLINIPSRLFFVESPADTYWREQDLIKQFPRELVFLNLPGQEEAKILGLPETKIIPTAAEFENGQIELLFSSFREKNGAFPPPYPDKGGSEELTSKRKEYWAWFDANFSATQAMTIVEEAASKHGRIRWIDYRVPISTEGDTLHLHVCPAGGYDTGVLAYNFIKRGFKHGLRLVGTLKSEPDMNVLAIYDK